MKTRSLTLALIIAGTAAISHSQTSGRPDGMRFVPDVPGQFAALTVRPDAMGFHIGVSPDPSSCKHYQAITRVDAADGTPYFLVTRSGNTPEVPGPNDEVCDDSDGETGKGNLIAVRMGSRDKNGERLRSNRLERNHEISGTRPPPEDTVEMHFDFDGHLGLPHYGHPGGMQAVGHVLALAIEHRYESDLPKSAILFFDVTDPRFPILKSRFSTEPQTGEKAGVVGVTPLPGGLYLMVVAGGDGDNFYFYRSTLGDLASPALSWEFVGTAPGPDVTDAHQTLQFVREGSIDGELYLVGARGKFAHENDRIDLYHVKGETADFAPGEHIELTVVSHGRAIFPYPTLSGGDRLVNLAAASGFYVSPTGELIFYATEHDNDGPGGTVKAGEWRHVEMVRENSPTLLPTAAVDGPFDVDEGASTALTGSAKPPITKAWMQLYNDFDFFGHSLVVDLDDYDLDNYDSMWVLDPTPPSYNGFAANAASWRWFAPPGCSIVALELDSDNRTIRTYFEREGTGGVVRDPDLRLVFNEAGTKDLYQKIDLVDFERCEAYYDGPFELRWDLDADGGYETTGTSVTFDAVGLDGPDTLEIPVEAGHSAGGTPGTASTTVRVHNVAPELTPLRLTDGAGNEVNVDVPFVLTGLPLTVTASFTDPGLPDHQSATIDWGDGTVETEGAFTTFDEAFGDGIGEVVHAHSYALPGTFPIDLTVIDDDGDMDAESAVVEVLTPEQAVEDIIDVLDGIIVGTVDLRVRKDLEKARKALAGNLNGENGALAKIRNGEDQAAIAFLKDAIQWLERAQAGGADVATLIALLEQVIAALSA